MIIAATGKNIFLPEPDRLREEKVFFISPHILLNPAGNLYRREGSQARSTAPGSGPGLAGVLGFESHPSHFSGFFLQSASGFWISGLCGNYR